VRGESTQEEREMTGSAGGGHGGAAPWAGAGRRRLLQVGGVLAAAAAAGVTAAELGGGGPDRTLARPVRRTRTGTIADLEHVVILMQENRSFDHYFGTLRGVRGFADRQVLRYTDGTTILQQPDSSRTDLGYLLPFHMDSAVVDAQNAGDLDHSWAGDHSARGDGLWNHWVSAKTERCMGYLTRADLPFTHALADAFTICDGYHQSILGPTGPNRMYFWTGTSGGATSNPPDYTVEFRDIVTYPELLLAAGISWQVYTNHEVGDGGGVDGWVGDYGLNPLWHYQQYRTSMQATTAAGRRLAIQGAVQPWQRNAGVALGPDHVKHVLAPFIADCAAGTIPQVSWIVAPYRYSEHPSASPSYGAHFVRTVLDALMGNPELWETSALFITYDEHDGYFDHALPPAPETAVSNEFVGALPIGFGPRVPMLICSPWTRGGYVDSNIYDHTSMLRFLETWAGVPVPNLTAWRRSVTGDLTAAFDFTDPDVTIPVLPDTVALIARSDAQTSFPPVTAPRSGAQVAPTQEAGTRPHRPSRHLPHADVTIDRSAYTITATMTNRGPIGVCLFVVPDRFHTTGVTPFTVLDGANRTYTVTATEQDGYAYAFSIYGPDRFVRLFAGRIVPNGSTGAPIPMVTAAPITGSAPSLHLVLANGGTTAITYTLTANDYAGSTTALTVGANESTAITWPVDADGYHDVIVTTDTEDRFTRRYAGRIG
jgi:phospholipase C